MKGITALCIAVLLAACGKKENVDKAAPVAANEGDSGETIEGKPAAQPAVTVPQACALLELQEVKLATGWEDPVAQDITADRSFQSSCNFVDSASAPHHVSVTASIGGTTYADSEAYARSVGDGEGMLSSPAAPVNDFGLPVIETQMGEIFTMRASTKHAVELTVSSASQKTTRELFVAALSRL